MRTAFALTPFPHDNSAPALPGREAAMAEIELHLNNLKRCLAWLVEAGFVVISVDMSRCRALPQIEVAPSPRLHVAFGEDCANVGRRQDGALVFYPWAARRHGCDIHWTEVVACN